VLKLTCIHRLNHQFRLILKQFLRAVATIAAQKTRTMFGANEGTLPMRVAAVPTIGAINRRENIVVHFLSFWTKKSRSHVAKNNSTAVITNSNVGEDRGPNSYSAHQAQVKAVTSPLKLL